MADFRRSILALAVVALLTGLVSTASAQVPQQPFACTATAAVPTLMRSEGLAELTGDIVLQCSGTLPAGSLNVANFAVFLGNTTITSRILDTTTGTSEALLLVDEPGTPGQPAIDPVNDPTPAGDERNTFAGIITGNQVQFLGIPVVPEGSVGTFVERRVFRITNLRANLRANASAVGTGAAGTPGQVTAFVSIVGPTSIPVNNAQQTVGFVQRGLEFLLRDPVVGANQTNQDDAGARSFTDELTFAQCAARGTGAGAQQTPLAALRFRELFPTAFKPRGTNAQTVPGSIYNTESGLVVSGLQTIGGLVTQTAGLADTGTRLRAVFNNLPNGLRVFVSNRNIRGGAPSDASDPIEAVLVASQVAPSVLNEAGVGPSGAVVPTNSFQASGGSTVEVTQLTPVGGTVEAVWEVIKADPLANDYADFWLYFGWASNVGNNTPALGTGTVAGSFAPISTVATASATAPIPRFADTGSAINVIGIVACRTNLLFPFVTNQAGFDTGIAIANTSEDIFSTTPQTGTCTLNFFGDAAPAPVTTAAIEGGTVYTNLAQAVAPGFQGYMIAQCGFQFAHGFAFISDLGARNLAMGYLALIIPDQTDNTRARNAVSLASGNGEVLGQ